MAYFQDDTYRNVTVKAEKADIERLKKIGKEHNETLQSTYIRAFKDFTGYGDFTSSELDDIQLALYIQIEELKSFSGNEAEIERLKVLKKKIAGLSFRWYPKYSDQ